MQANGTIANYTCQNKTACHNYMHDLVYHLAKATAIGEQCLIPMQITIARFNNNRWLIHYNCSDLLRNASSVQCIYCDWHIMLNKADRQAGTEGDR